MEILCVLFGALTLAEVYFADVANVFCPLLPLFPNVDLYLSQPVQAWVEKFKFVKCSYLFLCQVCTNLTNLSKLKYQKLLNE
jgi:hypothetical protein